jgi:hypothetical protein
MITNTGLCDIMCHKNDIICPPDPGWRVLDKIRVLGQGNRYLSLAFHFRNGPHPFLGVFYMIVKACSYFLCVIGGHLTQGIFFWQGISKNKTP